MQPPPPRCSNANVGIHGVVPFLRGGGGDHRSSRPTDAQTVARPIVSFAIAKLSQGEGKREMLAKDALSAQWGEMEMEMASEEEEDRGVANVRRQGEGEGRRQ